MVDIGRTDYVIGLESEEGSPIPICPNSSLGEGNCNGMVKYGTCPLTRIGGKGKFSGCEAHVAEQKKKK